MRALGPRGATPTLTDWGELAPTLRTHRTRAQTQAVYANTIGRIRGMPHVAPSGMMTAEITAEWGLVRAWLVNTARQVCGHDEFDAEWCVFKAELNRRHDMAADRPSLLATNELVRVQGSEMGGAAQPTGAGKRARNTR